MFLDFLKAGLAYRKESWVNWDPVDNTVLANEQVIDGKGWRTGAPVERRKLTQWFLRITAYADELLEALKTLDRWPDRVRAMQENWIGKSVGAQMLFQLKGRKDRAGGVHHPARHESSAPASARSRPTTRWPRRSRPTIRTWPPSSRSAGTWAPTEEAIETAEEARLPIPASVPCTRSSRGANCRIYVANFVLMEYGQPAPIFRLPGARTSAEP